MERAIRFGAKTTSSFVGIGTEQEGGRSKRRTREGGSLSLPQWSLMTPGSPLTQTQRRSLLCALASPSGLPPSAPLPLPTHRQTDRQTDRPQHSTAAVERAMVCDRNMTSFWTRNERMIIDHHETEKPRSRRPRPAREVRLSGAQPSTRRFPRHARLGIFFAYRQIQL